MNKADLITTRDFQPDDYNFVMATMLRGLFHGESWYSLIPKDIFMRNYHAILEGILASPNTRIRVACLKDAPHVVLGYSILSGETAIHFVYVKKSWRKIGIAKDLVPSTVTIATHLTKEGLSIVKKKKMTFNPFIT